MNNKNNILIKFPIENLDLENYIFGPDKLYSKYDLFAINQHYWEKEGGHYNAICKNIDGKWYNYDDSFVSNISALDINNRAAYILFYRKKSW